MRQLTTIKILLAAGLVAAGLYTPAASAQNIKLAVAANFATPLNDLITAYQTAGWTYSASASFTVTSGATATLAGNISTALAANSSTPYDILFSADDTTPIALHASYPSAVQSPFFYAEGKLVLWSKGPNVSASGYAGFPPSASYSYANGQVAIADPNTAPYGTAAQQVLARVNGITYPNGAYDVKFTQYSTIGTTASAVNNASSTSTPNMGFIHKSYLCNGTTGAYKSNISGSYYEYTPATVAGNPPHDRILQDAVVILGGSGSTTDAINDFAAYVVSTAGKAVIANWCYGVTP